MTDSRDAGSKRVLNVRNIEYIFHWCPPGVFTKGCPQSESAESERKLAEDYGYQPDIDEDWEPFLEYGEHEASVSTGFWILETSVTQRMWDSIMPKSWGYNEGDELPVDCISYHDARSFCKKLTFLENLAPKTILLPTETQWEYACRAGTAMAYSFGSQATEANANFNRHNSSGRNCRTPVRSFSPNAWGIYDMHGNIREWCRGPAKKDDLYGQTVYWLRGGCFAD